MTEPLDQVIDDYLQTVLRANPVAATQVGVHTWDQELGSFGSDVADDYLRDLRRFVVRLESIDSSSLPFSSQLDATVAIADAKVKARQLVETRFWERAPYWHLERLGTGASQLMERPFAAVQERAGSLLSRLEAVPAYLASVQRLIVPSDLPEPYVDMTIRVADGLQTFFGTSVPVFASQLEGRITSRLSAAARRAAAAVAEFSGSLHEIRGTAGGSFRAGAAYFDFLLRTYHGVPLNHSELFEWGREQVEADRARLEDYAKALDPDLHWTEQVSRIKQNHPRPEGFADAYAREMERARDHCVEKDLISIPDGEVCHVRWLPEYLRVGLPIAVMSPSPSFEPGLVSEWLITPIDPDAPTDRRSQHMRDNCYAFCESIAGHETYPGHHLQRVHHKLATKASPMRRYFVSPLFSEGWGLYTEDLLNETGLFDDPAVKLFKLRNALWRSVRVVIDTGLHTRSMSLAEATRLLEEEVALDRHMAEGEITRYIRHGNPTYPSSYLMGRTAIHDLRARCGTGVTLRSFHDRLLSYGSVPLSFLEKELTGDSHTRDLEHGRGA
ncbi:MAG: DUF885 domain-containing protein [bacterium]|nr:DUF885 domain-containing protein [bacterium]